VKFAVNASAGVNLVYSELAPLNRLLEQVEHYAATMQAPIYLGLMNDESNGS
jgi:hypothetical protein